MKIYPKKLHEKIGSEQGLTLALVLIYMLLGGILIVAVLSYVSTGLMIQSKVKSGGDELYAADAGVRDALWQIKYNNMGDVADYDAYDFDLPFIYINGKNPTVNNIPVDITINNIWMPGDNIERSVYDSTDLGNIIETGNISGDPADSTLFVKGSTTGDITTSPAGNNFQIKISYNGDDVSELKIDSIGIWVPNGFSYVPESCDLENNSKDYYPDDINTNNDNGGQYVVWHYPMAYPFDGTGGFDLLPDYTVSGTASSISIDLKIRRNATTSAGKLPEVVSWVVTDGSIPCVPFAWDNDIQVYKVAATAGSTNIEAYTIKTELRKMAAAISGDYYATGNSLMLDNYYHDSIRDQLLSESSSTVNSIPDDAQIQAAYLYWTSWYDNTSETSVYPLNPDDANQSSDITIWTRSSPSAWNNSSPVGYYVGQYTEGGDPARLLTLKTGISTSAESATISWDQWIPGNSWSSMANTPANIGVGGALAYDGNNYIYALRGNNSSSFYRYSISGNSWSSMANTPANFGVDGDLVYDGSNYIYALRGANTNEFYRYSISGNSWSGMANTPASIGVGADLAYDGSNYIYALRGNNSSSFYRYSISGNAWSGMTNTPGNIGTGGSLAYDGSNYIYALRGANTNEFYRYSISGNSWFGIANTPANIGVGGSLAYDGSNYIYALRGTNSSSFYRYSISGNSWFGIANTPANIGVGADLAYDGSGYIYALRGNNSRNFYCYESTSVTASDGLDFAFSNDNGTTWSSYHQAFRGTTDSYGNTVPSSAPSSNNYTFQIPSTYLSPNFKVRFKLVGFETAGCNIDDIRVTTSLNPDTDITFKINDEQYYFDEAGEPQQGNQKIIASETQIVRNTLGGSPHGFSYTGFKDVTDLVISKLSLDDPTAENYSGNAKYTVGDVDGSLNDVTSHAGWSLIIIYSSPETLGHQLYIMDIFEHCDHYIDLDFDSDGKPGGTISGFLVPEQVEGEVDAAKITCFVGEGDDGSTYTGDFIAFNAPSQYWDTDAHAANIPDSYKLWDGITTTGNSSSHPDNVWNGDSLVLTADGIDIDTFYITWTSGLLNQGDTSAHIDIYTEQDGWNLVYIILSFRSEITTGGTISYLIE
ncbi:MAG: hypothetical protein JW967_07495 [Dehalococcoidales bacterium]|nr:hypothetical protein [Dehalococcoidales bacterium]